MKLKFAASSALIALDRRYATLRIQAYAQAEVDKTKPLMDQLLLPTAPERPSTPKTQRTRGRDRRDDRR